MTDIVGVVTGVIGLAGVFSNCIEYLDSIRISRRFGQDFQTEQLALNLLELRLSRWGEASHVYDNPPLDNSTANQAQVTLAKHALCQIQSLLEDSRRLGDAYESEIISTSEESDILVISQRLRTMVLQRQKKTSTLKLTKWALYDKTHCSELIGKISMLLDQLETVFTNKDSACSLAAAEIRQICEGNLGESKHTLRVVLDLSSKVDKVLGEMAKDAISQEGISIGSMVITEHARVHNNDTITKAWEGAQELPSSQSSIKIRNFRAEGKARVANGKRYVENDDFWSAP